MLVARINGVNYDVIRPIRLMEQQNDIAFSRVIIDFEGKTVNDLPQTLQQVQIIENKVPIFTGYVNTFELQTYNRGGNKPLRVYLELFSTRINELDYLIKDLNKKIEELQKINNQGSGLNHKNNKVV